MPFIGEMFIDGPLDPTRIIPLNARSAGYEIVYCGDSVTWSRRGVARDKNDANNFPRIDAGGVGIPRVIAPRAPRAPKVPAVPGANNDAVPVANSNSGTTKAAPQRAVPQSRKRTVAALSTATQEPERQVTAATSSSNRRANVAVGTSTNKRPRRQQGGSAARLVTAAPQKIVSNAGRATASKSRRPRDESSDDEDEELESLSDGGDSGSSTDEDEIGIIMFNMSV